MNGIWISTETFYEVVCAHSTEYFEDGYCDYYNRFDTREEAKTDAEAFFNEHPGYEVVFVRKCERKVYQ